MGFEPYVPLGPPRADSCENTGATEFSWGPGAVPRGKECAPPSEGGQYVGRSPSMAAPPTRGYRPSGAPIGNPGDQIAR